MNTQRYLNDLEEVFIAHADPVNAAGQEAYMRHKFKFFGLKATIRRELQKPFLRKDNLPEKSGLKEVIQKLWGKPEREFQMFGQELFFKYARQYTAEDISIMEYMVTHKSWWDSVDFIAAKCMGAYFKKYPDMRKTCVDRWLISGNMWLQRSAILFQLKYKWETDIELLEYIIGKLLGSSEFFINKAIGWSLREYSKTDPEWVRSFAARTPLEPLSRKEALRLINKS